MLYSLVITVPPKTSDAAPVVKELFPIGRRVTNGIIRGLDDSGFRMGLRVLERSRQVVPANLGGWVMAAQGGTSFGGFVLGDPPSLTLVAYNWDDTYTHRAILEVEVV